MKYFKHVEIVDSKKYTKHYRPEVGGTEVIMIPEAEDNTDYARMMEEIEAGTSTIEEVDDTPE